MSNLSPESTGLPFVVWIAVDAGLHCEPSVWLSRTATAHPSEFARISIASAVQVQEGSFAEADLKALRTWIDVNREFLLRHWYAEIDSKDALDALRHP